MCLLQLITDEGSNRLNVSVKAFACLFASLPHPTGHICGTGGSENRALTVLLDDSWSQMSSQTFLLVTPIICNSEFYSCPGVCASSTTPVHPVMHLMKTAVVYLVVRSALARNHVIIMVVASCSPGLLCLLETGLKEIPCGWCNFSYILCSLDSVSHTKYTGILSLLWCTNRLG